MKTTTRTALRLLIATPLGPVEDEGFGLALLLAGGGVVAAAGSVLARQRVAQRNS